MLISLTGITIHQLARWATNLVIRLYVSLYPINQHFSNNFHIYKISASFKFSGVNILYVLSQHSFLLLFPLFLFPDSHLTLIATENSPFIKDNIVTQRKCQQDGEKKPTSPAPNGLWRMG